MVRNLSASKINGFATLAILLNKNHLGGRKNEANYDIFHGHGPYRPMDIVKFVHWSASMFIGKTAKTYFHSYRSPRSNSAQTTRYMLALV